MAGIDSLGASLAVANLRCEYQVNPLGIDVVRPRLTWQLQTDRRATRQAAYQLQAATSPYRLADGAELLWDTGRVESDQSLDVPYAGPVLEAMNQVHWRVRVWDDQGHDSGWSATAQWEMGLLSAADWTASWVTSGVEEDTTKPGPSPMLRREFAVNGRIGKARAYVTSLGLYQLRLNGEVVGDQVLTPGWTSYDTRVQYQTYDITDRLVQGPNALGAMLGDGWYRGYLAWEDNRNVYGRQLALLVQIQITYADGRTESFGTDTNWKATEGPVRLSDIYQGEIYDARLEREGWDRAGFDDRDWKRVQVLDHSKQILIAPVGPPVRRIQELKPMKIFTTPAGDRVVDFGQNMVGWVRLRVQGPRGTKITLRHAEVLDKEGNFYTENLRAAAQRIEVTLKGGAVEVYEPHFTFQGFRFVAVDGFPVELTPENLVGVVVHSDMPPTGEFECSNELLNQLQHNIQWGQKGNFVDVPTDCPQRDERLGWTGDAQVFAPTACFNFDAASFFTKWMADVAADQQASGAIPFVVPNVLSHGKPNGASASAGWADAAVIIPWTIYLTYGDVRILETQYPSMKAWVEYMRREAGASDLWTTGFHFGDWLAFSTTRSDYPGATTDKDLIASCYYAYSTDLLRRAAAVLGRTEDVLEYGALLNRIKAAFLKEFVTPNGRLASNTQTAYSLVLAFDLLPEDLAKRAAERLVQDVQSFQHITTGFLGTPLITHVLSRFGYLDEAYLLVNRQDYPSWLYPITQGATTIWERWDGLKPDGTFQDKGMNSFNHYAYGAVGDWLYRNVAGLNLDPDRPGYRHTIIAPHPGGGITHARASLETRYGPLSSAWKLDDGRFTLEVVVPPNTTATVVLPKATPALVTEGGRGLAEAQGILQHAQSGTDLRVEVGSGRYRFATGR